MRNDFALEVQDAVMHLRANYEGRIAPTDGALARARSLLNAAARQVEPPT